VPVAASVAGSAGNVQSGAISLIVASLPGVDTVTNANATTGGLDAESDAALRTRFTAYLSSLFRATTSAVGYAVASVQPGLQYTIQENATQSGAYQPGVFVVTVDDGSGSPPNSLLSTVSAAIEAMRPVGSTWTVVGPVVHTANVTMTIATAATATHGAVTAQVGTAVSNFIASLPVGATLPWSKLAQIAYQTSPSVANVFGVQINGSTNDVIPGQNGVVMPGSVTVY
jgi:uncharacterized phage protein gp47/JayE